MTYDSLIKTDVVSAMSAFGYFLQPSEGGRITFRSKGGKPSQFKTWDEVKEFVVAHYLSGLRRQYICLKGEVGNSVLVLLKLGDCWVTFPLDSTRIGSVLGLDQDSVRGIPTLAIPHDKMQESVRSLVSCPSPTAYVALAEEVKAGKPLGRYEITRLVTPRECGIFEMEEV